MTIITTTTKHGNKMNKFVMFQCRDIKRIQPIYVHHLKVIIEHLNRMCKRLQNNFRVKFGLAIITHNMVNINIKYFFCYINCFYIKNECFSSKFLIVKMQIMVMQRIHIRR